MGGLDSFVKVGQKFLPSPGVLFITHLVRILIHFLGGPLVKALPIRVRPCKLGSLLANQIFVSRSRSICRHHG